MCVQLDTVCKIVCEIIHCMQDYTRVPFAFNMGKFTSLKSFYIHVVTVMTDNYQVWAQLQSFWLQFLFEYLSHILTHRLSRL